MNSELSMFLFLHSNLSWLCGLGCVCLFLVLSLWQSLLSVSLSSLPLWRR